MTSRAATSARPGVYRSPRSRAPSRSRPVRLDVAGFVGVALRGPVNEPVAVDSWTGLPAAVRRLREPDGLAATGCCRMRSRRSSPRAAAGPTWSGSRRGWARTSRAGRGRRAPRQPRFRSGSLRARLAADEGTWGNTLTRHARTSIVGAVVSSADVRLPPASSAAAGRCRRAGRLAAAAAAPRDCPPAGIMRWVVEVDSSRTRPGTSHRRGSDAPPLAGADRGRLRGGHRRRCAVDDGDPDDRPRRDASAVWPAPRPPAVRRTPRSPTGRGWCAPSGCGPSRSTADAAAEPRCRAVREPPTAATAGTRSTATASSTTSAERRPARRVASGHRGVDAMAPGQRRLGLLCVPTSPGWHGAGPTPTADPPRRRRPAATSALCADRRSRPRSRTLACDDPPRSAPARPARRDHRASSGWSQLAELRRRFVVLLDVPDGLPARAVAALAGPVRQQLRRRVPPLAGRAARPGRPARPLVDVPPSAFAAGIIAARERRLGLPWGPPTRSPPGGDVADRITDAVHDQLHLLGINVFRAERDGFRLTAARTLSSDPDYRQLSVRRLMTMLALTLDREASGWCSSRTPPALRRDLHLRDHAAAARPVPRAGAFAGATEAESFFVRCDDDLNPRSSQDSAGWCRGRRGARSAAGVPRAADHAGRRRAASQVAPQRRGRCAMTESGRAGADLPLPGRPDRSADPLAGLAVVARRRRVQECSGLELEADVREYLEGGRNDGVIRRVGRVKLQPLVLKRGMFAKRRRLRRLGAVGLAEDMVYGPLPIPRYNGTVHVCASRRTSASRHLVFVRGLPVKVSRPGAQREDGRDRDRGAAHRARGPAAGDA